MVDRLEQKKRHDRELNVVKRARFNQTIEPYQTNEVPEPKFGVEPHTVKELPALPVRERRQDNMLQQNQDNMLEDGEVVSFGQRAQQQQDQQQLQLRQHNIPHNPVYPKQTRKGNSTIHVEHASFASPSIGTTRRSDGAVIQRDRRTGRTRLLLSGISFF